MAYKTQVAPPWQQPYLQESAETPASVSLGKAQPLHPKQQETDSQAVRTGLPPHPSARQTLQWKRILLQGLDPYIASPRAILPSGKPENQLILPSLQIQKSASTPARWSLLSHCTDGPLDFVWCTEYLWAWIWYVDPQAKHILALYP